MWRAGASEEREPWPLYRCRLVDGPRVNVVALAMPLIPVLVGIAGTIASDAPSRLMAAALAAVVLMQSPKVAKQWETRRGAAPGLLRRSARPRAVLDRPFVD